MTEKKEIVIAVVFILLMALIIGFNNAGLEIKNLMQGLAIGLIIIIVSISSKKIVSRFLDVNSEIQIFEWKRYGLAKRSQFKKPIPAGILFPLLLAVISAGFIKFFCFMQFNAVALPSKVTKRYGTRRFSGIMEWDDALIVFYSTLALLIIAVFCGFFNNSFFSILGKYSIYYAMWNLIPWGKLDGNKLFFGSKPLFVFTWIITLLSLLLVIL